MQLQKLHALKIVLYGAIAHMPQSFLNQRPSAALEMAPSPASRGNYTHIRVDQTGSLTPAQIETAEIKKAEQLFWENPIMCFF